MWYSRSITTRAFAAPPPPPLGDEEEDGDDELEGELLLLLLMLLRVACRGPRRQLGLSIQQLPPLGGHVATERS